MEIPNSVVFFVMAALHSRGISKSFAEVRDAMMNGDDFNKLKSMESKNHKFIVSISSPKDWPQESLRAEVEYRVGCVLQDEEVSVCFLPSSSNEPLNALDALIKRAQTHAMTPEEKQAQIESFVYGNVKLHNCSITCERIHTEAEKLKGCKTTPHDEIVAALRKRIDEQEEVLKGYFVKVKELEGAVEGQTKCGE